MAKTYVNVNYDGTMYTYSSTEKEDYKEHTSTTGKKTYRKQYNKGVEGTFDGMLIKKNDYKNGAEELHLTLGEFVLVFPILGQSGDSLNKEIESLIRFLPKMEKGVLYNINNYRINEGDEIGGKVFDRSVIGVSIKCNGTKIEPALHYKTDKNPDGEIPKLEFKVTAGKNRPTAVSKENKLDYLYEVLTDKVATFAHEGTTTKNTASTQSNKTNTNTPSPTQPEADELPF